MAYGMNSGYGMQNDPNAPLEQQLAQRKIADDERRKLNQQQQTPFAAQNRMYQGAAPYNPNQAQSTQATGTTTPVTADGKINEQNTPLLSPMAQGDSRAAVMRPGDQYRGRNGQIETWTGEGPPQGERATLQSGGGGGLLQSPTVSFVTGQSGGGSFGGPGQNFPYSPYRPGAPPPGAPAPTTGSAPPPRDPQADIQELMRSRPDLFPTPEDAQAWLTRYPRPGTSTSTSVSGSSAQTSLTPPPPGATYTPGTLPQYEGGAWTAPQLPNTPYAVYQGTPFSQWQQMDQSGIDDPARQAVLEALTTPSLPTDALKNKLRESQLGAAESALQQSRDLSASRGALGGGFAASQENDVRQQAMSNLLGGYRDIDIASGLQSRADLLKGIETADRWQSGELGRATDQYKNALVGQGMTAADTQAQIASENQASDQALRQALAQAGLDYQGWGSGLEAYKTALSGGLAQEGLAQEGAGSQTDLWKALQNQYLAKYGIDTSAASDAARTGVAASGVEADRYRTQMNFLSDLLGLTERARSTDINAGLDWTKILSGYF